MMAAASALQYTSGSALSRAARRFLVRNCFQAARLNRPEIRLTLMAQHRFADGSPWRTPTSLFYRRKFYFIRYLPEEQGRPESR